MKKLFAVLLLLIGAMVGHYVSVDRRVSRDAVASVVRLSGISQPSIGAAWYEPRMLIDSAKAENPAYPELDATNRSDYIYAQ